MKLKHGDNIDDIAFLDIGFKYTQILSKHTFYILSEEEFAKMKNCLNCKALHCHNCDDHIQWEFKGDK